MQAAFPPYYRFASILSILLFLSGCSGLERSEKEKIRQRNAKGEYIYRNHDDYFYPIVTPPHTPRAAYLWESETNLPRITKEFFRCKGSHLNAPVLDMTNPDKPAPCHDCESSRHGLPIIHGKEGVYPVLMELLNYIQKKTGHRVIITCGHRCPTHNTYADPGKENKFSKHQIGAEVDFYVQGMEDRPQEVIGLVMQYYQETPLYQNLKEYQKFDRYEKADAQVAIQPWFNKEIFIKLYQKLEGRDADNRHPHPYISLQVRFDRDKKERVVFNWEKAAKGYPRGA